MHVRSTGSVFPALALLSLVTILVAVIPARPTQARPQLADDASADAIAPALSEPQVAGLTTALDARLAPPRDAADSPGGAKMAVWTFVQGLQSGRLTPAQESGAVQHLTDVARARPELAGVVRQAKQVLTTQTVGKVAPEIFGRDLDGVPFKLSDYRGKVVVLTFTGDWCGICRSEYPYERFLLDLYRNWPLAILGVSSDADRAAAQESGRTNGLTYRSWWDAAPGGPIATRWSVVGWPTVYVIDPRGVIRFVDLRREDLLKGVRELLTASAPTGTGAHGG